MNTARAVVLISGGGSLLQALLDAQGPDYPVQIVAVVADRAAAGLDHAKARRVPTAVVSLADFSTRADWNEGLRRAVGAFDPDLVISAGFMRILGPAFLAAYAGRTINTHPALLPAFPGHDAVRQALAAGVATTGCSIHVVDEGMDTGPVIARREVAVEPGDDEASLHERIKVSERAMLVEVAAAFARDLPERTNRAPIGPTGCRTVD